MKTENMKRKKSLALSLLCLLLVQSSVTALIFHIAPTQQKKHIIPLPKNKHIPSTLKNIKQYTERIPQHRSLPHETRSCHHDPHQHKKQTSLHENHQKASSTTTLTSNASVTYWVKAGGNGNGTRDANPAGNITYVLNNLVKNTTHDTIKVQPGTYNQTVESFPLPMDTTHITLTTTTNASTTIINGTGTTTGIHVTVSNTTINGFTIKNCRDTWYEVAAIYLHGANDTTIANNPITNNDNGIHLEDSSGNAITGNVLVQCGIMLEGTRATFTTQRIAANNTVNGKPIYYYANQDMQGASVPSDAGQVILGNVTNVTIENVNVSYGSTGIVLGSSSYITITGNSITNNDNGIYLRSSSGTTITGNTITTNEDGISLWFSNETTITGNTITTNEDGIYLEDSSTSNLVYRNDLLNNGVNAIDQYGGNAFNTSTIGNYWGDYNGTDANGDGIGDAPYVIPGGAGSKDYHPAMTPFTLHPSPREPRGDDVLRFVIPIVVLATGILLGVLLVRYGGDVFRRVPFVHHARLTPMITTVTAYVQRFLTGHFHEAPNGQNALEATVNELGTRLEEPVREEARSDLVNLVRKAFSLLGKRFNVAWKDAWTVGEYVSTLIARAGPAYASLLREGYQYFEELLYAERVEWRDLLQSIHDVLVTITEKLDENHSSPTDR